MKAFKPDSKAKATLCLANQRRLSDNVATAKASAYPKVSPYLRRLDFAEDSHRRDCRNRQHKRTEDRPCKPFH